jgi:hypothetical protein
MSQMGRDLRPFLLPAVTAQDIANSDHRVDMRSGPMHPGAFQPSFDDQLVATFDDPAANRPALRAKLGILQLGLAFFQVSQVGGDFGRLGMLLG